MATEPRNHSVLNGNRNLRQGRATIAMEGEAAVEHLREPAGIPVST
ncbi:hypothetical protein [Niabella aurantiaca]|nr:hypothetical protein [Niabella aurantiaca]